jgi:hypothetical protein
MTLSAFIDLLRRDQGLRHRFAQNPRAVLRDFAVELSPHYDVPERLTAAQLERLLADWSASTNDSSPGFNKLDRAPTAPAVFSGPPPGPATPRWLSRWRRLFGRR